MNDDDFIAWLYKNNISLPRLSKKWANVIALYAWIFIIGLFVLAAAVFPFQKIAGIVLLCLALAALFTRFLLMQFLFRCPECRRQIFRYARAQHCPHCGKPLPE